MKLLPLGCFCLLLGPLAAAAAPPTPEDMQFFERRIRPVLVEHCQGCHSAKAVAENQLKGGLLVDSQAGLLAGGDTGPAVVPGKPDESLLIAALRYESFEMPPQGRLPDDVVA
ncbi:MAG: c-type cytochrome domain-containing protein, partial [Pirellulales bacterium]